MTVKRRDFQKAAALIHEFLLKLPEEAECAELRDSLNLSLLHMQRYYRRLRSRMQTLDKQNNGNHLLSQSLRGLSPMTPFRDTPDKFQWKWINLDNPKTASTLPADFSKEFSNLPQIITAAKVGDNNMLMQHIERDPDCIFEVDGLGRNALMYAVNFDHLDTVQILLENGIDVNATAHDGSTAVHRACHNGNHESLQILMEYSADLQIKDVQGRYPIHWACAHKERKCLQLLMGDERNNVDTTVRDNDGMTPSMWACRMDNIEHFELLSSVQVAVEEEDGIERDNNGRTWMHWSVRRTEPLECLKTLLTEDSACMKDEEGKTVMHTAAEMGSLPAVKIVMEIAGKEVLEQRDNQNHTPLILATIGGHGEVVNHLLAEGADLIAVDDTGATAWDYACKRQLHYCMLILASYIRQRAKEEEQGIEAGQGEGYNAVNSMADGTLGLDHLQINGQNGDFPILQGHRPVPPPHPPSEPITPRTPRVPRPKTPHANQLRRKERAMLSAESHDKFNSGVKRSPSTPDTNEAESFFEHNHNKPSSANSSKRLKNEHSPDRETLMSVMSVESPDHRSGHSHSATHSPNRSSHSHQDDEPEMANDSQYLDGGDDDQSRVSIDAMDVSDFEADGEDEDVNGVDGSQHHTHHSPPPRHHAHNPAPSPRPPPQPHPRHQQSPTSPPYSYAPSASRSGQQVSPPPYQQSKGSPPLGHQHAGNAYHSQQAMHDLDDDLPPEAYIEAPENGYVEQDDLDPEVTSAHSEDHAHQIHFPTGTTPPVETRVIPPAHLSPLPNSMPTVSRKKKKKKKKERSEHLGNDDVPQTRGYIAAIPPPLHQNQPPVSHPPPPGAQRGITPRGGMVGGAGNVRPNSGALKPMPKKRQSTSFTADDDHSFGGQNKSSKLSNQLSGAPSIAPKVPAPRPSSTSMHVPPLPQAQPRPQSSTPSHPKTSDTETLPDNRRILRHPDGGHANYEDADSDDYDERGQGHPGPTKRFQNMKQNGVMANEARGQHQNGPVQWTPSHNRREPSPAPRDMKHPPSPRGRRPPSGSLGSLSQQTHRTKHHLPNGRLPSSY